VVWLKFYIDIGENVTKDWIFATFALNSYIEISSDAVRW
jgi:hypothetical protein